MANSGEDPSKALDSKVSETGEKPSSGWLEDWELTRREFIAGAVATGVMATVPAFAKGSGEANVVAPGPAAPVSVKPLEISLTINGQAKKLSIDPRTTLLDLLREQIGLTGTKKGCDQGQCGACTVLVNGRRVNSCLTLAAQNNGREVTTIEGLANGEQLHPMQAAFIEHDAFQCGFCTPGQIMSAVALLTEPCGTSEMETRDCMSGNICRCGAYRNILTAIDSVRKGAKHAAV